MFEQITPVLLTYNEEPNISRTLQRLTWANDIVLVDSFSDDHTVQIASDFPQVRVFQRPFDRHRDQWSFALAETEIKTPWVLALDADYILTDEFLSEVERLRPPKNVNGYTANFIYCINGRRLRSGIYPPVTVLYRRDAGCYEQDGHTHRVRVHGPIRSLQARILHDDRKSLTSWFNAQARYSQLEAQKLLTTARQNLSWPDRLRKLFFVAPAVMLVYCLFIRGGLLDGFAGLQYALERTVAELMLSLRLIQHRLGKAPPKNVECLPAESAADLSTQNL